MEQISYQRMWRLTGKAKAGVQVETVQVSFQERNHSKTLNDADTDQEARGMEASKMSSKKAKWA